ncbi:Pepco domain-containing protein [Rhizobium leguminosarum]|uniref:Pepco domain-containing protein n=1 Tax=Rhizobium leguminosarum TaxID=384 RepID=UPI000414B00E|nr:hypothetical protein [Rhizobium leguminosarum]NEH46119.1 hypothetical protein [Rhizobium leguminosarum]
MHSAGVVPIFSDEDGVDVKNALPNLEEISARVHNVSEDLLAKNLERIMSSVEMMFSKSQSAMTTFSIKEVTVKLAVNGGGEFSLLGLTKASADIEATFELTLVPK